MDAKRVIKRIAIRQIVMVEFSAIDLFFVIFLELRARKSRKVNKGIQSGQSSYGQRCVVKRYEFIYAKEGMSIYIERERGRGREDTLK